MLRMGPENYHSKITELVGAGQWHLWLSADITRIIEFGDKFHLLILFKLSQAGKNSYRFGIEKKHIKRPEFSSKS